MRISDWSSDVCSSDLSDMFRDPEVFACLRRDVFPVLASYPQINIWQAGCAHGEEIYSLAILLTEAGLDERTRIYATDISAHALEISREGIYASREMQSGRAHDGTTVTKEQAVC